ncbi:putative protein kinase [Aspergillus clavatus NRRL 1]|uniref:Protein kinase, putative n=1 Tax=Aspergillus clavatus (strain ATCC 1007 / CBS 513.65 / DSM 816 / NCTC 3887 / NRRL 1 / QM 1276 / 107) TaxID=344612 RepID=A1C7Z3_ASPCL|nr:protein kinase, putative [Aspergillus clavatus NRRL 1]EAW14514.1 protein kinase, putative [Aspergillus clavatus NRRL 1]
MSMFRPASEVSSSDSQSSSDETDQNFLETSNSKARDVSSTENNTHMCSLDSGLETESLSDSSRDVRNVENEGHAMWMTTALLEFYCMSKAADILNAKESSMRYTRDSPEVQYLGKKLYSYESQVLSSHGMLPGGIHREEWGDKRQNYRDTLDVLGLPALEGLKLDDIPGKVPSIGTTGDVVLASKSSKHVQIHSENSFAGPSQLKRQNSGLLGFKEPIHIENNFPFLGKGRLDVGALPNQPFSLLGSSPVSFPLFRANPPPPTPNMSRYAMEFSEVKILGRGSFGEVYHVKNHIDGQSYAIKKIPLSQRRLQQLQCGTQNQLESIMKEIRTLARLEHMNVVRYYGAWVEQADTSAIFHSRSQGAMEIHHEETQSVHFSHEATDDQSFGIVFEHSESSAMQAHSESASASLEYDVETAGHFHRRYSHATTASHRSKSSLARSLEDDDEVESIPRDFNLASHGQLSTFGGTDDDIFTDGLSYDPSKLQVQRRHQNGTQIPAVILHIQMSLHPISLSSYLSPQAMVHTEDNQSLHRRHCFHLIPSLRLMLHIISGVEYLHAQGIIHRDLKPANIFLSSSQHSNLDGCPSCHASHGTVPRYCHPRIGDFGLVADMSHFDELTSPTVENGPKVHRVVGTEFYRPPLGTNGPEHCGDIMRSENQQVSYIINETLDVYALGVILFELLYRLNTKMERQMVLTDLTKGRNRQSSIKRLLGHTIFPTDFAEKVDMGLTILNDDMPVAESLMRCIGGMLEPNPQRRWRCADIKKHLESILGAAVVQDFSCS